MKDQENKNQEKKHSSAATEEVRQTGGRENAAPNRGGTTDMSDDAQTIDRVNETKRGSDVTTKNNVTGSDYDGQVSTS